MTFAGLKKLMGATSSGHEAGRRALIVVRNGFCASAHLRIQGNLEYLDEFERSEHGPNVFDAQQVREATALCVKISSRLVSMNADIAADAIPHKKEEVADINWPDAKS